jgi:riboflavin transporter FmnP
MKMDTKTLAGSAILGSLVIVVDYLMKFFGLKIPFPWLPYLKFDFTGVPIVLSLLFFGLASGATTSAIAFLAILIRSGDVVGASTKAIAEFATILGMAISASLLKKSSSFEKGVSLISGIATRTTTMFFVNLIILSILLSPLIATFNVIQGTIDILLGYFIHSVIIHRTSFFGTTTKT